MGSGGLASFIGAFVERLRRLTYISGPGSWSTSGHRHPSTAGHAAPSPIPSSEDFFRSGAWRTVRYAALRRSRGRCSCCGRSSSSITLHVDHVVPRSWEPRLALVDDNLQVLCEDCNLGKLASDSCYWGGDPHQGRRLFVRVQGLVRGGAVDRRLLAAFTRRSEKWAMRDVRDGDVAPRW
jgi:hypothetical protein